MPLSIQPLLHPQVKVEVPQVAPPSSLSLLQQRETTQEPTPFTSQEREQVQQREQLPSSTETAEKEQSALSHLHMTQPTIKQEVMMI
jgi:hypothetical protein